MLKKSESHLVLNKITNNYGLWSCKTILEKRKISQTSKFTSAELDFKKWISQCLALHTYASSLPRDFLIALFNAKTRDFLTCIQFNVKLG